MKSRQNFELIGVLKTPFMSFKYEKMGLDLEEQKPWKICSNRFINGRITYDRFQSLPEFQWESM